MRTELSPTISEKASSNVEKRLYHLEETLAYLQRDLKELIESNDRLISLYEELAVGLSTVTNRVEDWPFIKVKTTT
jgi:hypothetical protein